MLKFKITKVCGIFKKSWTTFKIKASRIAISVFKYVSKAILLPSKNLSVFTIEILPGKLGKLETFNKLLRVLCNYSNSENLLSLKYLFLPSIICMVK